jgi:shikimate kinase
VSAYCGSETRPIYLIGPPGVGKSTVGLLLAARLGREFVDLDGQIEREAGMSVREIFIKEREAGFRRREAAALRLLTTAAAKANEAARVVSVGGGAPCHEDNLEVMLASGLVVRLSADRPALLSRLGAVAARPLFDGSALSERLDDLLGARERFYARAHFSLDTTSLSASEVAAEVATKVDQQVRRWR